MHSNIKHNDPMVCNTCAKSKFMKATKPNVKVKVKNQESIQGSTNPNPTPISINKIIS